MADSEIQRDRARANGFTILANEILRRNDISARAKGVFAYVMSLPDDWKISKTELYRHFTEGKESLDTAFKELITAGYVVYEVLRSGQRISGHRYTFYETTRLQTGFQETVFQEVENPPLLKTKRELNTESTKKPEPEVPDTRQITDAFQEHFFEACGAKPTWGAKEGLMIRRLLASHNVGEILVAVRKYFEMDWWFAKNGERQFGAFVTHFDEILSSHHKGKGKPGNAEEVAFLEEAARL